MGLCKDSDGAMKVKIDVKFFIKLSKNFYQNTNIFRCYVSYAFGSPSKWNAMAKTSPKFKI